MGVDGGIAPFPSVQEEMSDSNVPKKRLGRSQHCSRLIEGTFGLGEGQKVDGKCMAKKPRPGLEPGALRLKAPRANQLCHRGEISMIKICNIYLYNSNNHQDPRYLSFRITFYKFDLLQYYLKVIIDLQLR